ncbi:hypothetical protein [Dokdonella sp.]|uniref:hypothetical protein n=1 Tax=Dokdonella sp. TaxID=2291710 RepID=UPI0025BA4AF1|nr:hypothetical protein [Dokdonella sp.]MBX3688705.1 hypothetical protein [Dokdonella sp.]
MRHLICATLIAFATTAALPAQAGRIVDMNVVDRDTGASLPTWRANGQVYVAGTPGHRYSVRLTNRSGGRVLAVLSVDGVNATTGETASSDQGGYVLQPWQSIDIAGWRKSLDEIAQFNFTALPNSYAARTGRPANVGVIGVAVFTERERYWERKDQIAREAAPPSPAPRYPAAGARAEEAESAAGASADRARSPEAMAQSMPAQRKAERLGTGHGDREYARVEQTTFERATTRPAEVVSIRYDSYANLVAQGIIVRPIARSTPQPFPNDFVPDPPAYR